MLSGQMNFNSCANCNQLTGVLWITTHNVKDSVAITGLGGNECIN